MNPLREHQTLRGHTRILARAYYLRPNNALHWYGVPLIWSPLGRIICHAGTKSARPSIPPSSEHQCGLTLIEPPRPYYLSSGRRSRNDGRKLLIPSTSRTLAARCGEPSKNLLASLDAPFTSAPSRQIPSPRNSWRTGHTGPWTESSPGWLTRSCPAYGRFQHLRVAVHLNPLGRRSLLLPSDAWNQEGLRDWIPSKSYRPISLLCLCVPFKSLKRLIYARVDPVIDPLLPRERERFRHGRSTVDQVTLLAQDIEDSFSAKQKAGAVFVDLTAAYDTVWHRGLTCKLLRLLSDRHMIHMIM